MTTVGVYFSTDTGKTRRIAKTIVKTLGDIAAKPINVRNADSADLLNYDLLILGTPTYGEGELPGKNTGLMTDGWQEFLPQLKASDFSGKKVALYGLGDQQKYRDDFASALRDIYDMLTACGAEIVGQWPVDDSYQFRSSRAVIGDDFVGLVLDEDNQSELTTQRLALWLTSLGLG